MQSEKQFPSLRSVHILKKIIDIFLGSGDVAKQKMNKRNMYFYRDRQSISTVSASDSKVRGCNRAKNKRVFIVSDSKCFQISKKKPRKSFVSE